MPQTAAEPIPQLSSAPAATKVPVNEIPIIIRVADGAQIKTSWFAGRNARASVVFFPAMGVEASFYHRYCHSLAGQGFNVLPVDLRGNGKHSVRASRKVRFGFKEMLENDWPAAIKTAKGLSPELPVILMGHSLGGQLCALYAAMHPRDVKALALVATPSVYYKGWSFPSNLRILAFTQLAWGISEVLGYFPGDILGFAGRESTGVIRDWARNARTGRYEPERMTCDFATDLKRLKIPVLAVSFADDDLCPKGATDNLLKKFTPEYTTHWHLTPKSLELDKIGHFSWAKQREKLIDLLVPWLQEQVPAKGADVRYADKKKLAEAVV